MAQNPLVIAIDKNPDRILNYKGIKIIFGYFRADWCSGYGWVAEINGQEYGNWLSANFIKGEAGPQHLGTFDLEVNAKETIDKLLGAEIK